MTDANPPDLNVLRRDFAADVERMVGACFAISYRPTRFLAMVRQHGAVETAWSLLRPGPAHDGLTEVVMRGRPKLSIEFLAQMHRYRPLFSPEQIAVAEERTVGMYREEDLSADAVSFV